MSDLRKPIFSAGTDGQRVEPLQELLDFGALAEVAAGHVVAQDFLAVFLEAPVVGLFVNAIDGRAAGAGISRDRHRFVGEQHVFLDQLVRDVVLDPLDALDAAGFVQSDLALGEIQGERRRV